MKVDRPSKNLITTLPTTASQTTTSATCADQVLALDVADEVEVGLVEELGGRAGSGHRPCPSPRRSRAARPAGRLTPRTRSAKMRAHLRVLGEVLAGGVGVGPDVEQDERAAGGDHLDRERRSIDAGQPAQAEDRRGHPGARVAGRHDRVGLAPPDEVHGDQDRGVLLLAQREGRMLVHPDDLRGVDHRDVRRVEPVAGDGRDPIASPTRMTSSSGWTRGVGRARRGRPRSGPWSPPIASTATRTRPLPELRHGTALMVRPDQEAVARSTSVLSSTAWRPLYQPQFGQTWCGCFGSWQCGHSTSCGRLEGEVAPAIALSGVRDLSLRDTHGGPVAPLRSGVAAGAGSGFQCRLVGR